MGNNTLVHIKIILLQFKIKQFSDIVLLTSICSVARSGGYIDKNPDVRHSINSFVGTLFKAMEDDLLVQTLMVPKKQNKTKNNCFISLLNFNNRFQSYVII